jgi:hypothetical protein
MEWINEKEAHYVLKSWRFYQARQIFFLSPLLPQEQLWNLPNTLSSGFRGFLIL